MMVITALLLSASCSKKEEDIAVPEKELLVGSWKFSQSLIFHQTGDTIESANPPVEGCAAMQTWTFAADGKHSFVSYRKSGSDCVVRTTRAGTYTFDADTKKLAITYPNETEIFQVFKVNEAEMWWNVGPIKLDEDTKDYLHMLVFKK